MESHLILRFNFKKNTRIHLGITEAISVQSTSSCPDKNLKNYSTTNLKI